MKTATKTSSLKIVTKLLLISYWEETMSGNQVTQEVPSMQVDNFNLILMNGVDAVLL